MVSFDGFAVVQRIRLLVVDPDPAERARLRTALDRRFEVVEASNAQEAVAELAKHYFDALLTDYDLGEPNGVWLLKHVFEHHRQVHRALMSTKGVPDLLELRNSGVVWLVKAKPVDPDEFSAYFAEPWDKRVSGD